MNHIINLTGLSFSTIYQICQLAYKYSYNPVTNAVFCYDPWDRSHLFIGNQATGQARGHHGSQVTNQQGVT